MSCSTASAITILEAVAIKGKFRHGTFFIQEGLGQKNFNPEKI